jgi:hypothetical protein
MTIGPTRIVGVVITVTDLLRRSQSEKPRLSVNAYTHRRRPIRSFYPPGPPTPAVTATAAGRLRRTRGDPARDSVMLSTRQVKSPN